VCHKLDKQTYLVDRWKVLNNIEAYSFGKRSALTDGDNITFTNVFESRGAVDRDVSVLFTETSVFGEVLKIISAHNKSSLHFVRNNHGLQDSSSDRHISSEWAFLIYI